MYRTISVHGDDFVGAAKGDSFIALQSTSEDADRKLVVELGASAGPRIDIVGVGAGGASRGYCQEFEPIE